MPARFASQFKTISDQKFEFADRSPFILRLFSVRLLLDFSSSMERMAVMAKRNENVLTRSSKVALNEILAET